MNKVILCGRLTRDPEVRYSQGERQMAIARYTLAVDRRQRRRAEQDAGQQQEQTADFIQCVAFDRSAEFAEKYLRQGIKMIVTGHIQTGSYTNREGQKVYTTEVIVEDQEFAESKNASQGGGTAPAQGGEQAGDNGASFAGSFRPEGAGDGFMQIEDGVDDEGLPFN